MLAIPCQAKTIYVDDDANGLNDGSSWQNAYKFLQDALMMAEYGDELRVAHGVYKPDRFVLSDRPNLGKAETFQLKNGVTLKGGYAGLGAPDPNARNIDAYKAILSGDFNGDDRPNFANNSENSYHVVAGYQTPTMDPTTEILDGFTITGGNANGSLYPNNRGGGMLCNSDATVRNCTFTGNAAICGGGIYCSPSQCCVTSPTLTNCIFIGNTAGDEGGGLWIGDSDPTVANCIITDNSAGNNGGGVMFGGDNWATFVNCLINANSAGKDGGAMYCTWCYGSPITNCTFTSNSAGERGGGIRIPDGSYMRLTNCILWGDSPEEISAELIEAISLNHCCIWGGWSGDDNIDRDPLFIDADGTDNISGTEDDNLRLSLGSPCIDMGDNSVISPLLFTDLDDNPRISNHIVDAGPYERQSFMVSQRSIIVPEGGSASFTVALVDDPYGAIEVNVSCCSGDADITVVSGDRLSFNSSNYSIPQTVTLAAAEDEDYLTGECGIWISGAGLLTAVIKGSEMDNEPIPPVLYVDARASGIKNGWSWVDAFTKLQDALQVAAGYSEVKEVRVAQGIYKPDDPFSCNRESTFQIVSGVAVKGGYAGLGASDPNARDIEIHRTTLSGDINGDDGPNFTNNEENSQSVVYSNNTDSTAVLDGFTITAGSGITGAGMYNVYGSPTLINCTFTGNYASFAGGGICNCGGSLTLSNCAFIRNVARSAGGAIFGGDNPTIIRDCIFISNSVIDRNGEGGAIFRDEPILTDCTFIGNSGDSGGALNVMYGTAVGCKFIANRGVVGGAIFTINLTMTNCIVSNNSADDGGGLWCMSPIVTSCTFSRNSANRYGGGIKSWDGTPTVTNCIFWDNTANSRKDESAQIYTDRGIPLVNYSCIQDWTGNWGGTDNNGDDPSFTDPNNDDYHLKSQAGRWGANEGRWVIDEVTSSCIDAGDPMSPIGREPFPNGGIINMGAYGGTTEASKSYFGEPPCEIIVAGDINGDCEVNFLDFRLIALHWCEDDN
jgi:predicted outer membrane repeat protein